MICIDDDRQILKCPNIKLPGPSKKPFTAGKETTKTLIN